MITNPTEIYFKDGLWGHDGTQWRRLNLLWGFYDSIAENIAVASATAGTNTLLGSVVPAGEVWVVTVMGAQDTTHAPSEIQLGASIKSIAVYGADDATPAAAVWSSAFCNIVLAAGDRIRAQILGCTLNDNLLLRYAGYKMKINLG